MKKTKIIGLFLTLLLLIPGAFAQKEELLNYENFLIHYFSPLTKETPASSQYIQLHYSNIEEKSPLYALLQKAVYQGLFPNSETSLPTERIVYYEDLATLLKLHFDMDIIYPPKTPITQEVLEYYLNQIPEETQSLSSKKKGQNQIFNQVITNLKKDYLYTKDLDLHQLNYGAIKGYVAAIEDPYTEFLTPKEARETMNSLHGVLEGIGVYLRNTPEGKLEILELMPDAPAEQAGLLKGDIIIAIEDKELGEKYDKQLLSHKIKGKEGTFVSLEIQREGKTFRKEVQRKKVLIKNIEKKLIKKSCYLRIRAFDIGIEKELLEDLKKETCNSLIFDLRGNPWGVLEETLELLSHFIKPGSLLIQTKTLSDTKQEYAREKEENFREVPIILLIDKQTASAAEIFAGVIRHYHPQSTIIGERSFGKWSVQAIVEYQDHSLLKYTSALWHIADQQESINGKGIQPDIERIDDLNTPHDEVLERLSEKIL